MNYHGAAYGHCTRGERSTEASPRGIPKLLVVLEADQVQFRCARGWDKVATRETRD